MRHFVTRRRINVSVAAARLLARPDVPARPLPSPTASSPSSPQAYPVSTSSKTALRQKLVLVRETEVCVIDILFKEYLLTMHH